MYVLIQARPQIQAVLIEAGASIQGFTLIFDYNFRVFFSHLNLLCNRGACLAGVNRLKVITSFRVIDKTLFIVIDRRPSA